MGDGVIPGCAWHDEVMSSRDLSSQPPVASSWHPATSGKEPYLPSKGQDPVLICCATTNNSVVYMSVYIICIYLNTDNIYIYIYSYLCSYIAGLYFSYIAGLSY